MEVNNTKIRASIDTSLDIQPPLPPPPPPPMPNESQSIGGQSTIDLVCSSQIKPNMKMRTLNWRRIPKRKVLCQQVTSGLRSNDLLLNSQSNKRQTCLTTTTKGSMLDNEHESPDDGLNEEDKNLWFLIAKENKSIKKINQFNNSTSPSATVSKSASKIREMLESVRRRMASVTASTDPPTIEEEKRPKSIMEAIDFADLENLFCLNNQPVDLLDSDSPGFVRRLSMRTNASSDSVISSNSFSNDSGNNGDDDDLPFELENILDSKKSLNVNIFLKQLKSPEELIDQINRDDRTQIGKERLESLLKLLPDEVERAQLMNFSIRNRQNRLPLAERFLLRLITNVPNLKLKIKFMLLQEEYYNDMETSISPDLDKIEQAVKEIRNSKMLRDILNLVLVTGNFLNAGGYAADAAGFSLDCLERLNDVRANKPGIYLIHYVAEVATKLDLIDFQQKELPHVELASRVCTESINADLASMMNKIAELKRDTDKEVESSPNIKENQLFLLNLFRTLDDIKNNVEFLKRLSGYNLEEARKRLADYLCEDPDTFKLHDCFHNILSFSQRLKVASEENERRRKLETSKFDRSNCSLRRSNTINPRLIKNTFGRKSLGNASNNSRTTSTFDVSDRSSEKDYDDLHESLMKLLVKPYRVHMRNVCQSEKQNVILRK